MWLTILSMTPFGKSPRKSNAMSPARHSQGGWVSQPTSLPSHFNPTPFPYFLLILDFQLQGTFKTECGLRCPHYVGAHAGRG